MPAAVSKTSFAKSPSSADSKACSSIPAFHPMRVPLAWRNVAHEKARAAVGITGVTFAIMLIFLQLGFYGSIIVGATQVYDQLDYDLVIVSKNYSFVHSPQHFPK